MDTKENARGDGEGVERARKSTTPSIEELKAARARFDARPKRAVPRTPAEGLAILEREKAWVEGLVARARERQGAAL